jgi:hypothetical protein
MNNQILPNPRQYMRTWRLVLLFMCFTQLPALVMIYPSFGTPQGIVYPVDSTVVNVQTEYGAKGDGLTDDTAALLRAIGDHRGVHQRVLYFPKGTYLVSDTLDWKDRNGVWKARLTFQGEGETTTMIRLKDKLPDFQDASAPRPVIRTGSIEPWDKMSGTGYNGFRNYLFDLTIDIGSENPGGIGIDYLGNNICGMENVTIRTSDSQLRGVAGLMMKRPYVGPCLYKHLTVMGFDYGIIAEKAEYSHTFVHLTVSDQKVAGIMNNGNVLSIRGLNSVNSVPALRNASHTGLITIIDSRLHSPGKGGNAIENNGGLFLRNLMVQGYDRSVSNKTGRPITGNINEYSTHTVQPLFNNAIPSSLQLPVKEAPVYNLYDWNLWLNVLSKGANGADKKTDSTRAIQAALDSNAEVVYLPSGQYIVTDTIRVRGTTKKLIGFGAVILPEGPRFANSQTPVPVFSFESDDSDLIIEGLQFGWYFSKSHPGAVWIQHGSPHALVLKHVDFGGIASASYIGKKGTIGPLFLEDVVGGKWVFHGPQQIWAQQFNVEGFTDGDKVFNSGATLWVLGMKTEKLGTVIRTVDSGKTELLGALLYPVVAVNPDQPAFAIDKSMASLTYSVSAYKANASYDTQLAETQGAGSRKLRSSDTPARGRGSMVTLYSTQGVH